jgi:uncharacterized membrane protein YsdA (DUF1294 family)
LYGVRLLSSRVKLEVGPTLIIYCLIGFCIFPLKKTQKAKGLRRGKEQKFLLIVVGNKSGRRGINVKNHIKE